MFGAAGGVAGFLMILAYGISIVKRGLKTQNDRDQIVGMLCVGFCVVVVVLGVTRRL